MHKLIVILGPTASGKSDLAIKLAKKYHGEIVSADSRQVYRGLNIGSGKITKKEMQGVPHYLLDVANPKRKFTVFQFQTLAEKAIQKIYKRGKIPFLVGGTGFYIQSVVEGMTLPDVKPNWKLRKKLEKFSAEKLFSMLKKLDSKRAKTIDRYNKRRLIRAIEIVKTTKKLVPKYQQKQKYQVLEIGIKKNKEELKKAINKRLLKRLDAGMIEEVKNLGLSFRRLEELGLEYKYVARYLQNKMDYEKMLEKLKNEIYQFSKRQMTWFKRDKKIHWITTQQEADILIKNFLGAPAATRTRNQ